MELWDLYDKNRRPVGKLHKRGETIPMGTYHIAVSIMTLNARGQLLITRRSPGKQPYPGLWEITAGSVVAGEESRPAALRELYEETGIKAADTELEFVHTYANSHGSGAIVDMYIVRKDLDISELRLQKGETEEARWVTPEEFDALAERGMVTPPVVRRFAIYRNYIG